MTDYTKTTNFTTKDSLPVGDAQKKVKGSEFDTEFNAIATAVATKANLASPTFTGTPSLPTGTTAVTQATATDNTTIATTAFVQQEITANVTTAIIVDAVYPVGSIYISTVSTNPATLLGTGTWSAFAAGRTLVGINSGDTDFDTVEETGGAKTHTLTVDEIPSHTHNSQYDNRTPDGIDSGGAGSEIGGRGTDNFFATTATGGGNAHNNLQPYIVTYMWKRTA